jgi:hypothetical protein
MHVLLSKLLETVRMEQEPCHVFPTAHFSAVLGQSKALRKRDLVRANPLVDPGNQAPCTGAVSVVFISKLRA